MADDVKIMRQALRLAARARGRTSPNPMVGSVLLSGGRVIAEDYHRRAGTPHAEALVLEAAGGRARGGTLYVTLEPCCHSEKRTPPCADAIVRSGVRRVVVAMEDPNPKVSGKGIKKLMDAGVEVSVGVLREEAGALNEAYVKYMTTGLPLVILKTAMTLDGKTATPTGESKWITGEKSRRLVHRLRGEVDAVLTAVGTVRADDPELTCRIRGGRNPLRVVIDPELEAPLGAKIFKSPPETLVVTKKRSAKSRRLESLGIKSLHYGRKLHLGWLMKVLAARGVLSVLIEGGASLNSHALNDGVVDKVMFFIAPKIIGGKASYPAVGGALYRGLGEAFRVSDMKVRRVGEDMLVEGRVVDPRRGL